MAITLGDILSKADPNLLADAFRKVNLGVMLAPTVKTITQSAAATVTLDPPALCPAVVSARVTAGVSNAGVYKVTDASGTPVDSATLGVATLSADGATLTFAATLTGVVVSYVPRSETPLTDTFNDFV